METLERLVTDIRRWRLGYQPVGGGDAQGLAFLGPLRKMSKAIVLGVTIALSLVVLYSLSMINHPSSAVPVEESGVEIPHPEQLAEVPQPVISEPEAWESELPEPEVPQPEVSQAEIPDPESWESEISELEAAEPEPSEPEVSNPTVLEPEASELAVSKPEMSEPEVPEPDSPEPANSHEDLHIPPRPHEDRRLVVIVPADSPSPHLCKFMMSAIALGYPTPIIVNWGVDYREVSKWDGGENLSKIPGIVRYLESVMRDDAHPDDRLLENDLVLVADGFDTWFQLPPDVLVKRYHESNLRANARLRVQWNKEEPMPMQQTIITASQKRCYPPPESFSILHCDALPDSPLRVDLYGPETDIIGDSPNEYHNIRPRFINGGSYIGPAGDMRRMFRRVLSKLESGIGKGLHMYSEQGLSGEVLGEQETWRRWRRQNDLHDDEVMSLMVEDFEYHIGLDYHQEISIPTVFEEIDGEIITLNNQSAIDAHSSELGISPTRLHGVPDDIRNAWNPLAGVIESPDWGEMPLYADFFTEAIPVTLHHNAHRDGLKERRIWWWDRIWYHTYLRELVTRRLEAPAEAPPLGTVENAEVNVTYWASDSNKTRRKPRLLVDTATKPLPEVEFDVVCRKPGEDGASEHRWWDEVFRDGKGPI